jgi:hypothetical protein
MNPEFSIVLPTKLVNIDLDLERLFEINLKSIDLYFDKSQLAELIIVAPGDDLKAIAERAKRNHMQLKIRLVDDLELCPCFRTMGGAGWFRQQVIKIASASIVKTKYYITTDDDIFMTRHAGMEDFIHDGKVIMSHIPLNGHPYFFRSSAAVLDLPLDAFDWNEIVMNQTPEIIITEYMVGAQREIETLWGVSDFAAWLLEHSDSYSNNRPVGLCRRLIRRLSKTRTLELDRQDSMLRRICGQWTEHSLYWTYLKKKGLTDRYYDYSADLSAPQLADSGIWTNEACVGFEIDQWLDVTMGEQHGHCFAVFSSKIENVDRPQLYAKIKQRLQVNRQKLR